MTVVAGTTVGARGQRLNATGTIWRKNFLIPFAERYKPLAGSVAGSNVMTAAAEGSITHG